MRSVLIRQAEEETRQAKIYTSKNKTGGWWPEAMPPATGKLNLLLEKLEKFQENVVQNLSNKERFLKKH